MDAIAKLRWASRKLRLGIRREDLVLDIGCGNAPNPRADVTCDMLSNNSERSADLRTDRPFVWARAERLPFKNDAFDFVILSHVLEHTFQPAQLLAEIQRVARRGYIETPAAWQEFLLPYTYHVSRVALNSGVLQIRIKNKWDDAVDRYAPEIRERLYEVYRQTVKRNPELCMTQYFWNRPIRFEVKRDEQPGEWDKLPNDPSNAQTPSKMYRLAVRVIESAVRRRRNVELLQLLACPECHHDLKVEGPKAATVFCSECCRRYVKFRGYYNFLQAG
jgi:SAM-dependent methyltransferase